MRNRWILLALFGMILMLFTLPSFATPNFKNNSKYFSAGGNATSLAETIHNEIPEQNTDLEKVNSVASCADLALGATSNYTITKTLCYLKAHINDYMQYAIYFWLTAATIFLIRNGFKIVTSQEREKEINAFKKRFMYLVIWVVLLVSFYIIIDIFVSVVNLVLQ